MASIPRPNPEQAAEYFEDKLNFTAGPVEVNEWLKQKDQVNIIDVRRREDYERGHVPGAINLPKGTWENPSGLSNDKTNIVYCYSQQCHLAASAAFEFSKKGYPAVELEGGFKTWREYQLPVEGAKVAA